ncbi:MAG TPA: response regulator [Burkholderiales bacterium]|nr:response regulator [Burkholderiales bacterium]
MAARTTAKTTPRRCALLYVGDHGASLAVVKQVIAGRKDLVLWRAADIDTALQLARRGPPEVMLVNVDLAAGGAVPLIKMLRANADTQATPILAVGSDSAPGAAVKSLEAGFFQYLAKPVQAGLLGEALDYALEFAALERAEQ